jgi:hypothetical protein
MFARTKYLPNPHSPLQPLDLRWRRCHYLVRYGRRPSRDRDDRATFDGWRYLLDRRTCRDRSDQERLAQRHPAVAAAYYLSRQARQAEPLRKAEVEARFLARQTDDDIATKCGLSATAVGAYHDLFYSVRDCLHADIHIYIVAIGSKAFYGLTENDVDIFLKILGYANGPIMLDAALRYFRNPPVLPLRLDGLDIAALEELHLMLLMRKLILTMVAPAHSIAAFVEKKLLRIPASAADGVASPGLEGLPDLSVSAFIREQVRALMPAEPPAVLPFDRSALQDTPDPVEARLTALCG